MSETARYTSSAENELEHWAVGEPSAVAVAVVGKVLKGVYISILLWVCRLARVVAAVLMY